MTNRGLAVVCVLLCCGVARAEVQRETITYQHGDQTLKGYLAWDDRFGEGKRPGVLVVHEWWGLNDYVRQRADRLAELGYVAFAPDLYGEGKVTEHASEAGQWAQQVRANVERWQQLAAEGLKILASQPTCDADRIAAIGYCFGGATVMQMTYAGLDVQGVVSFHGSLPVPTQEQASNIRSKVLICHGAADPFIPDETVRKFQTALNSADVDWQMISYGGAKHSFTVPGADEAGLAGLGYDADADRRSWQHMLLFFEEIFEQEGEAP